MCERVHLDVAIVGGGPGGLSAAVAISAKCPQLKVRVFEREKTLRRVGNRISMLGNGESALKAMGPKVWRRVEEDLVPNLGSVFCDFEQEKEVPPSKGNSYSLHWFKLRGGLSELLPPDCLKMGYKLQGLVQKENGVDLNFISPEESYHAKVVVGCDGYCSQVREICLQEGPPAFRDMMCWRGVTKWPEDWPYSKSKRVYWKNYGCFGVAATMDKKYLGWQVFVPWKQQKEDYLPHSRSLHLSSTGEENKKRCLDALEEFWPEHLVRAIKDTPSDNFTEHGLYARDPEKCGIWGKGSITLLGDAAHAMTPALGQGLNQALIDSAELGRAIGELGACNEALRQYESLRVDALRPIVQGSWDVGDGLLSEPEWHEQNPWCNAQVIEPL